MTDDIVADTPVPIPLTSALQVAMFFEWAEHGSWFCRTCGATAFWLDTFDNRHCARCDPPHTHSDYD
jgi:hypothetical protein